MNLDQILALPHTDRGNAEGFWAMYGQQVRFCPEKDKWIIWQGDRWETDSGSEVRNLIRQASRDRLRVVMASGAAEDFKNSLKTWLRANENERRVNPTYRVAQDMREFRIHESELDRDLMLAGCPKGQLELARGQFLEPSRESFLTMHLGTAYDPKAECPRWLRFLQEIFLGNQSLIDFVQVAAGYCLTGRVNEQVMFVCVGEGANGKSTFLGTLYRLFGDYATSTPFSTFDAKSRNEQTNDLARLKGKRFVTIAETDEDSFLAEQKIKQATGDDPITCRFLHKEFFEYMPQFKIWMAANRIPSIKGVDFGIKRRLMIIPFDARFDGAKRDNGLRDDLMAELPGILNWVLEGCSMWQEAGLQDFVPSRMKTAIAEYEQDVDLLASWADECLEPTELGDEHAEKAIDLFDSYKGWMLRRNHRPKSVTQWGRDMRSKGIGEKKRTAAGMVYVGVKMRPEAMVGI